MNESITKREFLKIALTLGILAAAPRGIEWIKNDSEFSQKNQKLMLLIEADPANTELKQAYSAFVQSHIAILGGYTQGLTLASENLSHYLYGEGEHRSVTTQYRSAVVPEYGTMENYMSHAFSYAYNYQENIIEHPQNQRQQLHNLGFHLKREKLPDWSSADLVVKPTNTELFYGLGNHTLRTSFSVETTEPVAQGHELSSIHTLVKSLTDRGKKFVIQRYTLYPKEPIQLYDEYLFKPNNTKSMSGAGYSVEHMEVKEIFDIISMFPNVKDLAFYMGQLDYESLIAGEVNISTEGMNKLEQLHVANSFEIVGSFKDVGKFPVDLIIRN